MDECKKIVRCGICGGLEYWGEMRWRLGFQLCRKCYRDAYNAEHGEPYQWNDLDGPVPTQAEYLQQQAAGL